MKIPVLAAIAIAVSVAAAAGTDGSEGAAAGLPGRPGKVAFVGTTARGDTEIFSVNPNGTGLRQLTHDGLLKNNPTWSPDGLEIVYVAATGEAIFDVYLIKADGTGMRRLTVGASAAVARWAPDGSRLVLTINRAAGGSDLEVRRSDGSAKRWLFAQRADRTNGLWSPDGGLIAFSSGADAFLATAGGRVTATIADAGILSAWFPDGQSLVVLRSEVVQVDRQGNTLGTVVPPKPGGPAPVAISPDQRRVAFEALRSVNDDDPHIFVSEIGRDVASEISGSIAGHSPDWQSRCTIYGTARADRLRGTKGPDKICGLGGDDVIYGNGGSDVILGGEGNDCIIGGGSSSWLFGGDGNDRISAPDGRSIVDGGPGLDRASFARGATVRGVERKLTRRCGG